MKLLMIGLLVLGSASTYADTYCYSSSAINSNTGEKIIGTEIRLKDGFVTKLVTSGMTIVESPVEATKSNQVVFFKTDPLLTKNLLGGPYRSGELHYNRIKLIGSEGNLILWLNECSNL